MSNRWGLIFRVDDEIYCGQYDDFGVTCDYEEVIDHLGAYSELDPNTVWFTEVTNEGDGVTIQNLVPFTVSKPFHYLIETDQDQTASMELYHLGMRFLQHEGYKND